MIVETAREIQAAGSDLTEYLRVIAVPVSTFGLWARDAAAGKLVPQPPRPLSLEETTFRIHLCEEMKMLKHRRNKTFGLDQLWARSRGKITRDAFREMANEVRIQVNRELRAGMLRYEFPFPDVAHSLDFVNLPREVQTNSRRYMIRVLDDCTRCTLRKEVTLSKGAIVGGAFVHEHLKSGPLPLVFKYDREFDTPQFENLLLSFRIVPLPSPRAYPQGNGKNERANGDVQGNMKLFGDDQFWTVEELRQELNFFFEGVDEIEQRAILNGKTRRKAYDSLPRAAVDRDVFFKEAVQFRSDLLRKPGIKVSPTSAWWVAAKETLKRYELVRYSRQSDVSGDSRG